MSGSRRDRRARLALERRDRQHASTARSAELRGKPGGAEGYDYAAYVRPAIQRCAAAIATLEAPHKRRVLEILAASIGGLVSFKEPATGAPGGSDGPSEASATLGAGSR